MGTYLITEPSEEEVEGDRKERQRRQKNGTNPDYVIKVT